MVDYWMIEEAFFKWIHGEKGREKRCKKSTSSTYKHGKITDTVSPVIVAIYMNRHYLNNKRHPEIIDL